VFQIKGRGQPRVSLLLFLAVVAGALSAMLARSRSAGADQANPATVPPTTAPAAGAGAGDDPLLHAEYQQYKWSRNDPPVRMIAKDEGFCFLSEVGGHFAGGGEAASVYIGDDGFWYLGGHAAQDLWAKAYSIKLSRKIVASVVGPPNPADVAWRDTTPVLTHEGDQTTRELIAHELAAMPSDPEGMMALADDWRKTSETMTRKHQRLIEPHVFRLYDLAINNLSGAPRDAALHRLWAAQLALAQDRLDDLGAWHINGGDWSATPDGKIEGHGNSEIVLTNKLPPDCFIEFHMMPVEGIRTRIKFQGTDLYVGNEGFTHHIEVYGAETQRGVPFPYVSGDEMKIGIKFAGKGFELYINGELMSRGTRKTVPDNMGIAISAGDDWDGGTTRFWGFKITR